MCAIDTSHTLPSSLVLSASLWGTSQRCNQDTQPPNIWHYHAHCALKRCSIGLFSRCLMIKLHGVPFFHVNWVQRDGGWRMWTDSEGQWEKRIALRKAQEEKQIRETAKGYAGWVRQIGRHILWLETESKFRKPNTRRTKIKRTPLLGCNCGCLWHDTVLTTLRWERLPERQQRTQEEPAPCELGPSALHGQETHTHTHREREREKHTQGCTPEQLLPQQSPLCSFIWDGLPGLPTTRSRGKRQTHKQRRNRQTWRLAATDTIFHGRVMIIHRSTGRRHLSV